MVYKKKAKGLEKGLYAEFTGGDIAGRVVLRGDAQMHGGKAENATLSGRARMFGGALRGSWIGSVCSASLDGDSLLTGGQVEHSHISDGVVCQEARISKSVITGNGQPGAWIGGRAILENCALLGPVWIGGDAYVACNLMGAYRIHAGVWFKPPRFADLGFIAITECVQNRWHVGCECRALNDWRKMIRLGRRVHGWTNEQLNEAVAAFNLLTKN